MQRRLVSWSNRSQAAKAFAGWTMTASFALLRWTVHTDPAKPVQVGNLAPSRMRYLIPDVVSNLPAYPVISPSGQPPTSCLVAV